MRISTYISRGGCFLALAGLGTAATPGITAEEAAYQQALLNGQQAQEGFRRSLLFVKGWLAQADPYSGLIPRNLKDGKDIWNPQDAGADNYPFMVLSAYLLDRPLFHSTMRHMLDQEIKLTSRLGKLPDVYSFSKKGFLRAEPDKDNILFGAAEYMKDGLMPITEYMGESPWYDRMLGLIDDFQLQAEVVREMKGTYYGNSPVVEINGDLLQILSRLYWKTGQDKYLQWAMKIGDHYLLENNLPTTMNYLRLRDHGCEILNGLCELYVAVHYARPEKKKQYQAPLHALLDQVLRQGRNADGLFYNGINPLTGEVVDKNIADTWGYLLDGYYSVYLIDKKPAYREAVLKVLGNLHRYKSYAWEGNKGSDGFADAIESALNLYNREPLPAAATWIDSEIREMWAIQQASGIVEGWHGDGNFARTSIMYSLWKTQGATVLPWQKELTFGALREGKKLRLALTSTKAWQGHLFFDTPRHRQVMNMPLDYPRINQFPEWFTVKTGKSYRLKIQNGSQASSLRMSGQQLAAGIPLTVLPGTKVWIEVLES